jgi:hypothetical protein
MFVRKTTHLRLMAELRELHDRERGAWAQAAAVEREALLRHAADERAALIGAIDAARAGAPAVVAAPWTAHQPYISETDEIEADRQGQTPEEYLAGIDRELASRGFAADGSELTE